jgi:hypothetical protein
MILETMITQNKDECVVLLLFVFFFVRTPGCISCRVVCLKSPNIVCHTYTSARFSMSGFITFPELLMVLIINLFYIVFNTLYGNVALDIYLYLTNSLPYIV